MFLKESKLGVLSLSLTGAEEFGAVLAAQSDDSHAGCNCRDDAAEQPQLLEECRSGERSSAAILGHQGAGDIHGQDSKDDGVISGVENGEVGTLLRVVGQAGLSRLGNDALAAVADDVQPFRFLKVCHGP